MEIENNDSLKYWQVQKWSNVAILTCPEMDKDTLPFGTKRAILVELKKLQKRLSGMSYSWWAGYAKLTDPHIMRMWVKVGGEPFYVNLKSDHIWFRRKCK